MLAQIPKVPEAFLSPTGALQPLLLSINTIGEVVVPVSCMIVGSELYRSFSVRLLCVCHDVTMRVIDNVQASILSLTHHFLFVFLNFPISASLKLHSTSAG